jgi:hypothetical protein
MRAGLDKELVAPAVEGLERLGAVDVVDEHAAVRATVESDAERLETLLTRRVPKLKYASFTTPAARGRI